jgi:RimJ/RimL family protein N-acetyltransferase
MELIPIKETLGENGEFINDPLCQETIYMTIEFYRRVGFYPPWICYYFRQNGNLVGSGGFKGKPVENTIEIAYGTFEKYRKQGVGTKICKLLVELSLKTDPDIRITARTLPIKNFSTRILQKNSFEFAGTVDDPEDGEVWEWQYRGLRFEV